MNRRGQAVPRLGRGAVPVPALLALLACEDLNLWPIPGKRYSGQKPWVTAAIDVLLPTYLFTEADGHEILWNAVPGSR